MNVFLSSCAGLAVVLMSPKFCLLNVDTQRIPVKFLAMITAGWVCLRAMKLSLTVVLECVLSVPKFRNTGVGHHTRF